MPCGMAKTSFKNATGWFWNWKEERKKKREGGKTKERKEEGKEEGIRDSKMSKKSHTMCVINIVENITVPSYWTTMGIGK